MPLAELNFDVLRTARNVPAAGGQVVSVSLTFAAGRWNGESQMGKYPALCRGTFSRVGTDSVHFENACFWTAEFDWTLILSGNYKLKVTAREVELSRSYEGGYTDIYRLNRK